MRSPLFLTVVAIFSVAMAVMATPLKTLSGHVPAAAARLQSSGRLAPEKKLRLAMGLTLRNQAELHDFLQAVYDPASPQYRHYLSPDEFTERFGPSQDEYDAVIRFAETNGFTVAATHADRMLLEVNAAARDVERAFHLALRLYPHPAEARTFFAPDAEPSAPADLAIADISGLNNYLKPRPANLRRQKIGTNSWNMNTSRDGSGPDGNFIGSDYRAAYAPGTTLTGAGQTVGLLEYDNFFPGDVTTYEYITGLTNPPPVSVVLLGGYNGTPGDGDGEVALDVEMAMSMAPGLSGIVCYAAGLDTNGDESVPANVILCAMASSNSVKQLSSSWLFESNPQATMDYYFQKFQAQGQSFYQASGDHGAYPGAIDMPSDDPNITVVGGTVFLTGAPNGAWMGEITWNAPDIADSSGGGVSTIYPIPPWQVGVSTAANLASTVNRNVPDVSMVADNIFIVADRGCDESSGGTSAAAPLWAAFTALINQQAVATGHGAVGFINPAIYGFYTNSYYSACFDDITFGNTTNFDNICYFATLGYDLCTGLGSPAGGSLIIALACPDGFVMAPGRGFTASGPVGGPFSPTTQKLVLTNAGQASLNWTTGGQPAWLNVSSQGGALQAATGQTVTVSLNSTAQTLASGVYTANVWFTNLTSGLAQLRQFTLQINQDLVHDGGFEAGMLCYWTLSGEQAAAYCYVDNCGYTGYLPHSGYFFVALGEIGSLAYISQPLATTAGQPYLISFWLENPTGYTPNQFEVEFDSATMTNVVYNQSDLGASAWQNIQILTVASSTNTQLQFGGRDDNDFLCLDDVSVVPAPLPTVQSVQRTGSNIQINWAALAGLQYQVQSASSLTKAQWTNLGNPVTAAGNTASATETIGAATQQFYRVVLLVPM
jgi:subtilase family serine protease